jgi:hypothetical protein
LGLAQPGARRRPDVLLAAQQRRALADEQREGRRGLGATSKLRAMAHSRIVARLSADKAGALGLAPPKRHSVAPERHGATPGGPSPSLLSLQRSAGNRAVTQMLAIQRKMAFGPERIDEVRSTTGKMKGALTKDTLYRLRQAVADHQASVDTGGAPARLAVILGLCDTYLERHKDDTDENAAKKLSAVEDLKAAALAERGQLQAQAQYLTDAYAKKSDPGASPTRLSEQMQVSHTHSGALALGKGKTAKVGGAGNDSLALVRKYGLTQAEILAVRTYTASDYKYINPATANSESWMKAQNKVKDDAHMKNLKEEGSLHAAMAISGLKKLPPMKGLCYRGARMNEKQLGAEYTKGKVIKRATLTSVATQKHSAAVFADAGGETKPQPDQTIRVMVEIQVTDGREAAALSIYGRGENEWLLLPGSSIKVDDIIDEPSGPLGAEPKATRWVTVKAHQEG